MILSGHMPGNHLSNLSEIFISYLADMTLDKSDKKQNSETKDAMGNMMCTHHRQKITVPNKIKYSSTDEEVTLAEQQNCKKTRMRVGQNIPRPTPSEQSPLLVGKLRASTSSAPPNAVVCSTHGYPSSNAASRFATSAYPVPYLSLIHI